MVCVSVRRKSAHAGQDMKDIFGFYTRKKNYRLSLRTSIWIYFSNTYHFDIFLLNAEKKAG